MAANDKEQRFLSRIRGTIATVEAWDADPTLLAECRLMIPFEQLVPDDASAEASPYYRDDDFLYQGNALFLKRLAVFFQKDVMTWVNAPPCGTCNSTESMDFQQGRGPETAEEREGQANRVEVYCCKTCTVTTTTFPRYNSVRKLLETRQGRCGEYANLFGLYCRAAGFETRYVMDWTDHVWIEALVGDEWIMADSCEGAINKPSMYESGWGKKLNYTVGITTDAVVDVTPRYTRKFYDADFQERRRAITSSEAAGEQVVASLNASLRQRLSKPRVDELESRTKREIAFLDTCKSTKEWTEVEKHGRGRISGSLEWKASRHEEGNGQEDDEPSIVRSLYVEQLHPRDLADGDSLQITVLPQSESGILISRANCDVGQPECISVVILDGAPIGCVLQCRSFASWSDLGDFCATLPSDRVVVLKGRVPEETLTPATKANMSLLGGFTFPSKPEDGVMFVGQLEAHPDWSTSATFSDTSGFTISFAVEGRMPQSKIRTERGTAPTKVAMRLPESAMPLQTQLLATAHQKWAAFAAFRTKNPKYVGYTTMEGCPVYVIDSNSFPLRKVDGWNTFHYLPEVLVPEDDNGVVEESKSSNNGPKFDIPLEDNFFTSLFGPWLLRGAGTNASVPTSDVLSNTRLVGIYFSAHWCPPCRRFTPMLIEAYNHLKEEFPSHGLEMVFVSSDRSDSEFNQYYASMPWAGMPYQDRTKQKEINMRYGVRGIPALVILDAMSGQIVCSTEQSRTEVMQACQRGDEGIEAMFKSWLDRIPNDSKELMSMLEMSCEEDCTTEEKEASSRADEHPYLVRDMEKDARKKLKPFDVSGKVKELFAKLVSEGEAPNSAAAKAIKLVGDMPQTASYEKGPLNDIKVTKSTIIAPKDNAVSKQAHAMARFKECNGNSEEAMKSLLKTLIKYLDNAVREPWNPKFRNMKLSNTVVDRVATRMEGGLDVVESFGMAVVASSQDFFITVPLAADPDLIRQSVSKALAEH
jgi:thiol-disulfide isomerase/thioredoxin